MIKPKVSATKNDIPILLEDLNKIKQIAIKEIPSIIKQKTEDMAIAYKNELSEQGREGNTPPLSETTKRIYAETGGPTGELASKIVNRIETATKKKTVGVVGFDDPEANMIASVQEFGTTIPVTEAMREYLAGSGAPLSDDTTAINVPGRRAMAKAFDSIKEEIIEKLKTL